MNEAHGGIELPPAEVIFLPDRMVRRRMTRHISRTRQALEGLHLGAGEEALVAADVAKGDRGVTAYRGTAGTHVRNTPARMRPSFGLACAS